MEPLYNIPGGFVAVLWAVESTGDLVVDQRIPSL